MEQEERLKRHILLVATCLITIPVLEDALVTIQLHQVDGVIATNTTISRDSINLLLRRRSQRRR
jgi:hypothetical protein